MNGGLPNKFLIGSLAADPGGVIDAGSAYVYQWFGLISAPPCVARGDVNSDGSTDIVDVVNLIQGVVSVAEGSNSKASDTNCDGTRDIADIVLLIQYVVFGTPTPCCL